MTAHHPCSEEEENRISLPYANFLLQQFVTISSEIESGGRVSSVRFGCGGASRGGGRG